MDGWAHDNLLALETFFTPWHALFYSGFVGYGLGVAGAVVFTAGGAGDLVWHSIFGVEQDIEARFSPTTCCCSWGRAAGVQPVAGRLGAGPAGTRRAGPPAGVAASR